MEADRNRRRDNQEYNRRRSAENTRRDSLHTRPAADRPVRNYDRSVSRPAYPREHTDATRYERRPAANERASAARYERSNAGHYERPHSASRLPESRQEPRTNAVRRAPKKKSGKTILPFVLFIVGLAVLGVLVWLLMGLLFGSGNTQHNETKEGITYLESLETKNPAVIDEVLAANRKKRMEVERDIILQKLLSDETDVWSMFHDYVILGDSRAVGFYYYDFLEKSRVLADGGDTIRRVAEHMDEIKALNPSYIFLCYGLNDVSIGYWNSPEEYTEEFMEVCNSLKQAVPGARIIVSSILPARDPAFDLSSLWREIPTYSDTVQQACEENDILFVDNSQTCEDHADLWDIDGIHVRREFYSYWARNLIVAVIEDEAGL